MDIRVGASGEAVERPGPRRARPARPVVGLPVLVALVGVLINVPVARASIAQASILAAAAVSGSGTGAPSALRIAVAPFEDALAETEGEPSVARQLSRRFEQLGVKRLLAPGTFVAETVFDPRAEQVRTWADRTAVDTVIVGRVVRSRGRSEVELVEAVARSGHSGAELFRHAVHVASGDALASALDGLADAIVRDLGVRPGERPDEAADWRAAATTGAGALPDVAAGPKAQSQSQSNPETPTAEARGGLETRLGVAQFDTDAPIEIQADQAEITAGGEERILVFQGSVRVKQGEVSLASDRLEAEYAAGESEPRRLVARGAVRVSQGNRSARCDRAEYLRAEGKVSCRGHAELVQGCDVVRGELIVLDLMADKARVEGAASIVISPKQNAGAACKRPAGAR